MKPILVFVCLLLPAVAHAQQAMYENHAPTGASSGGAFSGYIMKGLFEWNKLSDNGGLVAADSSGNGNTLPLIGSPAWGSDDLNFNGSSQYGDAGSSQLSSLDYHDLTVSAWVNKTGSSLKGIVDKSYVQPGVGYGGWSLRVTANNQLDWWIQNGQDFIDNGAATLTVGQWTFVTVVWHYSAQEADFYINGVLNSKVMNGAAIESGSGPADFEVGNIQNNLSGGFYAFDGAMHDVAIYNRVLSASEVEDNYLGTEFSTNVGRPDLLYYKMTENAQTNPPAFLADSSTHGGTTGTVFETPSSTLQWVTNVASIPKTALHFDGFSTYIDTSNSLLFNFTTNLFTINLWVCPLTANCNVAENGISLSNGWYLNIGGSYQIQFGTETNGQDFAVSTQSGATEPEIYTMVTIVRTGPTNVLIYINGIQAATTGSITIPASSTNSLIFGMNRTGGNFLNGDLWLPQIWGEVLPATTVANLYFEQSFGQSGSAVSGGTGLLANGLIEWNKFFDGSGTVAADASGNGNTLPLIGSPTWGADFLTFNGSSQYGDAGNSQFTSLDQHDLTIGVWLNKNGNTMKGIVDKSYVSPGVGYGGWSFRVLANNQLDWWVQNGQDLFDNGAATITPGQWTFAAVVWHYATHEADFYINGVVNSKVMNGASIEDPSGPANLEVGNMQNNLSSGLYAFDGSMHDLGIYNRALSAPEVESNYLGTEFNTNVGVPDLLYYKMTEYVHSNPPVSLADSSTHGGTTGTVFAQFPTRLEWVTNVAAIPQTALHFNGVSTYIETSNSVLFNFTTNLFTINFWLCPLTANGYLMENGTLQSNGWYLSVGGSYQIQFGAETNGTDYFLTTGAGAAQVGVYTMVTIVRAPTNLLIYINGIQAATTGSFTSPGSSTNTLRIGTDRAEAHVLDGDIWLPQIWGEALPATAVANLYFAQLIGQPWP